MFSSLFVASNLCEQNFTTPPGAAMLRKLKYISAL